MQQLVITDETIRDLRKEQGSLRDEVREREEKIRMIQHRLDAIAVLMPESQESESARESNGSSERLPDAIRTVVREAEGAIKVAEIRQRLLLRRISQTRFGTNSSYLYTVLKRLGDQGELTVRKGKHGKTYKMREVPAYEVEESQGEDDPREAEKEGTR